MGKDKGKSFKKGYYLTYDFELEKFHMSIGCITIYDEIPGEITGRDRFFQGSKVIREATAREIEDNKYTFSPEFYKRVFNEEKPNNGD